MKVHKIVLYVYGINDREERGFEETIEEIEWLLNENEMFLTIDSAHTEETEAWDDDHPLNYRGKGLPFLRELFTVR